MKTAYRYFAMVLLIGLMSCQRYEAESEDSSVAENGFPQKWQLTQMTGSFKGSATTGRAMAWQEYYILHSDRTFMKSRTQDGITKKATGTFEFIDLKDGKYLQLDYDAHNDLIGTCTYQPKRELLFADVENVMNGTWLACDGPGLRYEIVEDSSADKH